MPAGSGQGEDTRAGEGHINRPAGANRPANCHCLSDTGGGLEGSLDPLREVTEDIIAIPDGTGELLCGCVLSVLGVVDVHAAGITHRGIDQGEGQRPARREGQLDEGRMPPPGSRSKRLKGGAPHRNRLRTGALRIAKITGNGGGPGKVIPSNQQSAVAAGVAP